MNEQIREFAKQAGFYKYGDDFEEIIEKFAELIVRECASVCDDLQKWPSSEPRHCASDIKKHFGIEESPTNGETK